MDLRRLKTFLHVADLGSLSRAAGRLDSTQSTLSRQIRSLEEELKVRLFVRTGRGLVLTEAGRSIERHARAVLDEAVKLIDSVEREQAGISGRLAFGMPPSVGVIALAGPIVAEFRARFPNVALQLREDPSGEIQEKLLDGTLDLGVLYEGATSANIHTERLYTEELWLAGPSGSGLERTGGIPLSRLPAYPLILPGLRHGLRAVLQRYALREGLVLNTVIEVDSLRALWDLVAQGLGYTVLPPQALPPGSRLSAVAIMDPTPTRSWVMARRRDEAPGPAVRAMEDLLREYVATRLAASAIP